MAFGENPDNFVKDGVATAYPIAEYNVIENGGEFTSYDNVLYTADKKTVIACPFGKTGKVTIAKEATSFRSCAFFGCQYVTEIMFDDGGSEPFVMKDNTNFNNLVGKTEAVFFVCPRLTSISFPSRLKSIGSYALYSGSGNSGIGSTTTGLTIEFAENGELEEIGDFAFYSLKSLKEFTLPANVSAIGKTVFHSCTNLKTLNLPADTTAETLSSIVQGATALTTVNINEANNEIVNDNGVILNKGRTFIAYVLHGSKSKLTS